MHAYAEDKAIENFKDQEVWIGQNARGLLKVKMVSISKMNDHYVVKFAGFDSIDKARKISGESIYVEESDLPALKKGEYYFYQIIGSDVYYESGEFVGPVKDIIQTGSNDVLIIGEEEILIPVIKDYIVNMDIKSKKITVRKLEWF